MIGWLSRKPRKDRAEMTRTEPLRLNRQEQLDRLETEQFDIVIVGGGITGVYAALDASLRGYRVAVIEKDDFASGTSSKSSKMVHGGLRYIEQGNLGLVRHSLHERQRLRRNARHLVQRLPFLFPILEKDGVFDKRLSKAFESLLWTYDVAGGWREGILHQKLTPAEVLSHCPTFKEEGLLGGFLYFDARVDDARLTLTVARTAAFHGAAVVNHAKAVEITRNARGKVDGVVVQAGGREIRARAGVVVMATGVWLRDWTGARKDDASSLQVRPAKGVHVAVPWLKVRNDCTVTIPVPGRSRRATITRWGNLSYLGTTDEDYEGDLDDVYCTRRELDFLLEGARSALKVDLRAEDAVGSIAGCRPLVAPPGGKTLEIKRNHVIRVADDGLVTVVGGKLTTSRHMAEQTIDAAQRVIGKTARCQTRRAYLLGAAGYDPQAIVASGGLSAHLGERYGTEARFVSDILEQAPALVAPIVEGLPYTEAEVVYAARHELAGTVEDVLSRRMRARLMARDASARAAARVGQLLQAELGLPETVIARQVADYLAAIKHEKSILMGEQ
ncbi:glycerol-3-phosphate dehydrogenase/oxidase [Achromobacter denitrificans]|jgi:glycerol-3-phosphate dehydrogenase|uniref:glycerol-3-phosphate dehydrogenase/oxidase n=1 Tax=Achromobacter denitrificans TaxID=32002 RepID=UPI000786E9D3|nr:glycerol-3-phosphate dehydrogenase/oxidase [Achromobacter denitrificans]ASC67028.1 glycerol-3-phosphate dehydrogenase/oxidase [Achromobacter denitrificans]MDF3848194.1 glycerol-3-phosphate dehydrogenase/oxidase [Achromobacter denitrificans]OLU09449.1 FAD-dependent oxidoreductase [Achromobacter denitrificans]QCS65284.1 glycerol-3-phosphate dehydrogenase/oxidase [Achromobacter denitrificans]QKH41879.1 glycerol-3-phosphate dehydrogenase/oxidase [Achromobacter denitrificans]